MDFRFQTNKESVFPISPTNRKMVPKMVLEVQCIFMAMVITSAMSSVTFDTVVFWLCTIVDPIVLMTSDIVDTAVIVPFMSGFVLKQVLAYEIEFSFSVSAENIFVKHESG